MGGGGVKGGDGCDEMLLQSHERWRQPKKKERNEKKKGWKCIFISLRSVEGNKVWNKETFSCKPDEKLLRAACLNSRASSPNMEC